MSKRSVFLRDVFLVIVIILMMTKCSAQSRLMRWDNGGTTFFQPGTPIPIPVMDGDTSEVIFSGPEANVYLRISKDEWDNLEIEWVAMPKLEGRMYHGTLHTSLAEDVIELMYEMGCHDPYPIILDDEWDIRTPLWAEGQVGKWAYHPEEGWFWYEKP